MVSTVNKKKNELHIDNNKNVHTYNMHLSRNYYVSLIMYKSVTHVSLKIQ